MTMVEYKKCTSVTKGLDFAVDPKKYMGLSDKPKEKIGYWIMTSSYDYCSECDAKFNTMKKVIENDHCPKCGCKMEGVGYGW